MEGAGGHAIAGSPRAWYTASVGQEVRKRPAVSWVCSAGAHSSRPLCSVWGVAPLGPGHLGNSGLVPRQGEVLGRSIGLGEGEEQPLCLRMCGYVGYQCGVCSTADYPHDYK